MKQPFWILPSALLTVAIGLVLIALFLPRPDIEIASIKSRKGAISRPSQDPGCTVLIAHNIFALNSRGDSVASAETDHIGTMPPPPQRSQVIIPEPYKVTPLEPLKIQVTGIVSFSNDQDSALFVMANDTKKESSYKLGDKIEDGQIIAIFNNRAYIVRINGQQEIVYLREQDARTDSPYPGVIPWSNYITPDDTGQIFIDPQKFVRDIGSLGSFIELLNISTAYQAGKRVGVKIGSALPDSLASALGFEPGDIILSVNNLPVRDTQERLAVYKLLMHLSPTVPITVKIMRNQTDKINSYILAPKIIPPTTGNINHHQRNQHRSQIAQSLAQQYNMAPTLEQLKKHERALTRTHGSKRAMLEARENTQNVSGTP